MFGGTASGGLAEGDAQNGSQISVAESGAGEISRVLVAFLIAVFPLVISIATGLLATPPELVELGRSFNATHLQALIRIRLPPRDAVRV